jgi:hypothetical protein
MAGRTQVGRWQPSDGQTTKSFSQLKAVPEEHRWP